MRLGPVMLAQAQPKSARRQLGLDLKLSVQVNRDGIAAAGVPVEVMLADGSVEEGVTDPSGSYTLNYGPNRYGLATVLITPPDDVRDMGEDNAQAVDLQDTPANVLFEMHSLEAPPSQSRDIVAALATTALLVFLGVQAS